MWGLVYEGECFCVVCACGAWLWGVFFLVSHGEAADQCEFVVGSDGLVDGFVIRGPHRLGAGVES
jgi:hypothetical protein